MLVDSKAHTYLNKEISIDSTGAFSSIGSHNPKMSKFSNNLKDEESTLKSWSVQ